MTRTPGDAWTVARVDRLKELWAEGQSAAQIAKELGGVSRLAICGKARRLKLPEHSYTTNKLNARLNRLRADKVKTPPKPRPNNLTAINAERRAASQDPGLTLPASAPLPGSTPRPWPERRFGECTWPVGDGEGPDLLSCCNAVHARGWCVVHFMRGTAQTAAAKARPVGDQRHGRAA